MQKIKFFLLFVMLQALLFADIKPDQSATEGVTTSVISEDTWGGAFACSPTRQSVVPGTGPHL